MNDPLYVDPKEGRAIKRREEMVRKAFLKGCCEVCLKLDQPIEVELNLIGTIHNGYDSSFSETLYQCPHCKTVVMKRLP